VKRRPGIPNPALERSDAPTLALSTSQLDVARLRQLLVFERTLRRLAPPGCNAEETKQAHAAAVAASGLVASEVEAPLAVLRRFAANRALAARLTQTLGKVTARVATDPTADEQAVAIRQRLASLDEELRSREDEETQHVLAAHGAEILALFAGAQEPS
jgi:hypothetical protein